MKNVFALLALSCLVCVLSAAATQQAKAPTRLKYAIIVSRHGVRSPTWTLDRLNQYSGAPWPEWEIPPGNLTAHGRQLMKIVGGFYHDYFTAQGLLGNPNCSDSSRVYFWADTDQRTLETAVAVAEGLLPACKVEIHSIGAGKADPLFDPIEAGVVKQDPQLGLAAVAGRIGPQLAAVVDAHRPAFDILAHVLNGNGKAAHSIFEQPLSLVAEPDGVAMNGPLSLASTFTENLLLEYANGLRGEKFAWGRLDADQLQQIMTLHTAYADLMRRTPYVARVRGSNLLNRVLRSIEQAVNGKPVQGAAGNSESSLVFISGHDTNLSNLSGMLNLSWLLPSYQADDAPPGGALIFSLWQSSRDRSYFVRIQFLAQTPGQMHDAARLSLSNPPAIANVFVPGCSTAEEGFPCEWQQFHHVVEAAIDPAFVK